jgi:Flp pilus assembly pilin Flp
MKKINQKGQGMVEYTLIIVLVALVFWVGMRASGVEDSIRSSWSAVKGCLDAPMSAGCSSK